MVRWGLSRARLKPQNTHETTPNTADPPKKEPQTRSHNLKFKKKFLKSDNAPLDALARRGALSQFEI